MENLEYDRYSKRVSLRTKNLMDPHQISGVQEAGAVLPRAPAPASPSRTRVGFLIRIAFLNYSNLKGTGRIYIGVFARINKV